MITFALILCSYIVLFISELFKIFLSNTFYINYTDYLCYERALNNVYFIINTIYSYLPAKLTLKKFNEESLFLKKYFIH